MKSQSDVQDMHDTATAKKEALVSEDPVVTGNNVVYAKVVGENEDSASVNSSTSTESEFYESNNDALSYLKLAALEFVATYINCVISAGVVVSTAMVQKERHLVRFSV